MRQYAENSEFGRNNSRLLKKKKEYNLFLPKMGRGNLYHEIDIVKSLKYHELWHQKTLIPNHLTLEQLFVKRESRFPFVKWCKMLVLL